MGAGKRGLRPDLYHQYRIRGGGKKYAGLHPEIQFCEATAPDANDENGDPVYENYHTFMGEIYQGRYISGVVAGMKLKELLDQGILRPEEAKVGYVAAYSSAEVISGYTAFFLGVRSIVPEAVMEVKYTNTWSNYNIEKQCADELIDRGCVIISQHSDTTGPDGGSQQGLYGEREKLRPEL
ncbi:MAG: BMP family ABC transporter substrate-binding protein [Eubacterium sp.]|nr:BMP family ABC transporter substrate-binding protein [Eubacterium sp.]